MSKTIVITDSTANLSPEYAQEHKVAVIPLNIHWGDEQFKDSVDITPTEFYERLEKSSTSPSTSQPSPEDFLAAYKKAAVDCSDILVPVISSGISGTFHSAVSAESECEEVDVQVVDTKATASSLELIVKAVVRDLEGGKSIEEARDHAEAIAKSVKFYFMVDTLEYLHRGGRIGGAKRLLGSALNIKPILFLDEEGKIGALEQVRTKKKAMARLVELAAETAGGKPSYVGVVHANALESAQKLSEMVKQAVECKSLEINELSPVIGVHVGPGTLGVAVYPEA